MDKDTGDTQGQEIVFTDEQQKFIDKLVGSARIKARDMATKDAETAQVKATEEAERTRMAAEDEWKKLAQHHEGRVTELEPFEAEVKVYREMIAGMLKDRVKELGDAAKVAIKALPASLSDLEKLNWLNQNQALFESEGTSRVGTPAKRKPLKQAGKPLEGHRPVRL